MSVHPPTMKKLDFLKKRQIFAILKVKKTIMKELDSLKNDKYLPF